MNRPQHTVARADDVDVTSPQRSSHLRLFVGALVLALLGAAALVVDGLATVPSLIFVAALVATLGGVVVMGWCAYGDARTSGRGFWGSLGQSLRESLRVLVGLIA